MKTVLITGADGMLGSEITALLRQREGVSIHPTDARQLDITDLRAVRDAFHDVRPTHVAHCAAFTHVDMAEKEPLRAYQVNADGAKNVAFFCRELDAEMVYFSTDYVFSGEKGAPYTEEDEPAPINVYGMTKLEGETHVQGLLEKFKIVRTSWLNGLGGERGRNFIETMLRISETRDALSLVTDQVGGPTFAFDLARAVADLMEVPDYGIYHVTNGGQCSWFEFAQEVFRLAGRDVVLRPVSSEEFRSTARRPAYSVLENRHLKRAGITPLPCWKESLKEYFRQREELEILHGG